MKINNHKFHVTQVRITIVIRSSNFESKNNIKSGRLKWNPQTFAVF